MVEMKNITKVFGPLVANDNINFTIKNGEVHALLGENGAGKSTLMSILFGLYRQDEGEIYVDGELVEIRHPNDATKYRIGMVHQHFKLVEVFSVLENIILGIEDTKNGFLTTDQARIKVENIMNQYNLRVDLDAKIKDLTVGQQQKVEIIKMLYRDSDTLIFDEPTAVLTPQEIDELMDIIKNFAKEGKAVVLITHKLNEIKISSDRCTVLRRGKHIATVDVKDVTTVQMAELMVGRPLEFDYKKKKFMPGEKILEVVNLTKEGKYKKLLNNISFNVRAGEIVGIAGIDGNGQTELVYTLAGLEPATSGNIILNNMDVTKKNIRKRYEQGLSYVPEDRQRDGLVLEFDIANNVILQSYYKDQFQKNLFLKHDEIYKYADRLIEKYDIRSARGAFTETRSMSGGNQQKVIIAREIEREHNLLMVFQPTRGLDVGAIENIHQELINERDKGNGVLLISYELDEILNLADRILVIYEGEITLDVARKEVDANKLGLYMSGHKGGSLNE